jgi:hypothetical protein
MLLFKVNLRINLLSKITHLTTIKNLKHTSRSLHLNADNEICKPQEFNTCIFGQHDPRKTPMGKTSEEEFIMEFDKELLQQRIQESYSQTYLKFSSKSSLKVEPTFLEVHALSLGICILSFCCSLP